MLDLSGIKRYTTRGSGQFSNQQFDCLGKGAVIEAGVRVFFPENIRIGDNCFIGHSIILDGYHNGHIYIGPGTWIGPFSYLHGGGGIDIGCAVGIGPRVTVLTSQHDLSKLEIPILHGEINFEPVRIEDGADIGAAAVILPGVTIGHGAQVGGGAVVTRDVPPLTVAAGNPARPIRDRRQP